MGEIVLLILLVFGIFSSIFLSVIKTEQISNKQFNVGKTYCLMIFNNDQEPIEFIFIGEVLEFANENRVISSKEKLKAWSEKCGKNNLYTFFNSERMIPAFRIKEIKTVKHIDYFVDGKNNPIENKKEDNKYPYRSKQERLF